MDKEKLNLILDRLLEKTSEGKLQWETTVSRNTFLVVLQDSSIAISRPFVPENTNDYYEFDFRNEAGDIVERVVVSQPENGESIREFGKAEQIYNLALQQSLKTDKTVDRILEQLMA